jgi:S1-C subfamily serine protease
LKILRDKQEHVVDVTLDAIKEKVDHSIDEDAADDHPSGKMGVAVADAPEGGALIRAVEPLSPADGELLPGDVVLTVEGKKIDDAKALAKAIAAAPKGKALLLEVERDNKKRWVGVELK